MPQKIQGIIFTEIIPKLIPEVDTRNLVRLGSIARKMNRTRAYEPLTDALRKIQWVKLTAIEALSIERSRHRIATPHTSIAITSGNLLRYLL